MNRAFLAAVALTISFGAGATQAASPGAKIYGNAQDGRTIVNRWCESCHSMGPVADDRFPSFPMLAKDMARSEGAIRAFLMRPHKPMPPLDLSTRQIEDIIAFLHTVQPDKGRESP